MKIKNLVSITALPVLLIAPDRAVEASANPDPKTSAPRSRQRRTAKFPANLTAIANISSAAAASITTNSSRPAVVPPSTGQICAAAFKEHQYTSLNASNPAEVCAQDAVLDGRNNLHLASLGYGLAGDDALKNGFDFKAALSYSKAAVLEHTLRRLDDVGLVDRKTSTRAGVAAATASAAANRSSTYVENSNEAKAFTAFQKIGDYVAMEDLRKSLGARAHARFPKLSDLEKVKRYNFHDEVTWTDVSAPNGFGVLERTLNSGNILRLKFDTDLVGLEKNNLAKAPRPGIGDLKLYGNAFVKLIDLSPTFRHQFYGLLERNGRSDYTVRVNLESGASKLGYTYFNTTAITIFPYHPGTERPPVPFMKIQTVLLHEFSHDVQIGTSSDSDGTTVMRPDLGNSHDRQQTAFMGGVINEYNHFLALANNETDAPDSLGMPIKTNIDRDDYCEDLMLIQPEWKASKGARVFNNTATAIENNNANAALTSFSKIATSDQIDIRMYNAQFGRNVTYSHIDTYSLAEVSLQQLLVQVDRADWFAAKDSADDAKTRETMGKFLNLLVEQAPANANDADWRTTINGAFNYLSMDPKVEVPGYLYADRYPDGASSKNPGRPASYPDNASGKDSIRPESAAGTNDGSGPLIAVMVVMSAIIAGFSLRLAKSCNDVLSARGGSAGEAVPARRQMQALQPELPV